MAATLDSPATSTNRITGGGFFKPATRKKSRLRMALDGVSGSGKTFTALRFAFALGQRVAVINTESGAVEKYLGLAPDGTPWQFDVGYLQDFSPTSYTAAILQAGKEGYDVVIVDSLSHAWAGAGGALELKDKKGGNSFTAWKDITPMHNRMIEAILHSPCHTIVTMRSKTGYVLETDQRGQSVPRKIGMEPVQRNGMEYEFDIYGSIDCDHVLKISKSRCPEVADAVVVKPSAEFMRPVIDWLNDGSAADASFFAVTEEDLRKFEKRTADEAKQEQASQPRKSAMELMKEQAAAAEAAEKEGTAAKANGQSPTVADPPASASSPAPDKITDAQLHRLRELVAQLQCGEAINAALSKLGIGSARELPQDAAVKILANLEKKAAAAAAESATPASPVCGPATQEQIDRILQAGKEFAQTDNAGYSKFFGEVKAWLAATGKTLKTIDANQAAKLYDSIRERSLPTFIRDDLEKHAAKEPTSKFVEGLKEVDAATKAKTAASPN